MLLAIAPAIRPLGPDDRPALRTFLAGLSAETRYRRFFSIYREPSDALVAALMRDAGVAVDGGRIVGHVMRAAVRPGTVDVGVVVADDWQRRGIGPELVRQTVASSGAHTVELSVLALNGPANRMIRRLWPGAIPTVDSGTLTYVLPAIRPRGIRVAVRGAGA